MKQLSLFDDYFQATAKIDLLLGRLSDQAANIRFLITRVQYSPFKTKDKLELTTKLEIILESYRALCTELKKKSIKYHKTAYNGMWRFKDHVMITDPDAYPSKEEIFNHLDGNISRYKGLISANREFFETYGMIVDHIHLAYNRSILYLNNI